tara:strand:- start:37 stop:420 length:384 start_codon:yes stop_codon:yes gene_type:complete
MNWEDIIKVGFIPSDARKRSTPTMNWMDAFDKFGFDDGEENKGQTEEIADFLSKNGYKTQLIEAGGHNTYIKWVVKEPEKFQNRLYEYPTDSRRHRGSPSRDSFDKELLKLLDDKYGKSMKSEGIKG